MTRVAVCSACREPINYTLPFPSCSTPGCPNHVADWLNAKYVALRRARAEYDETERRARKRTIPGLLFMVLYGVLNFWILGMLWRDLSPWFAMVWLSAWTAAMWLTASERDLWRNLAQRRNLRGE